ERREKAAKRSTKSKPQALPFGDVPPNESQRYFGSTVTLAPPTAQDQPRQTTVTQVHNRGKLIEVRDPRLPDDPAATIRIPAEQIQSVDELVDANAPGSGDANTEFQKGRKAETADGLNVPPALRYITGIQEALRSQGRAVPWQDVRDRWEQPGLERERDADGTVIPFSKVLEGMIAVFSRDDSSLRRKIRDNVAPGREAFAEKLAKTDLPFHKEVALDILTLHPDNSLAKDALELVESTEKRIKDLAAARKQKTKDADKAADEAEAARFVPWSPETVKKPTASAIGVTKTTDRGKNGESRDERPHPRPHTATLQKYHLLGYTRNRSTCRRHQNLE
ncbi:MAG: hypothetical protein ACYTEQ_30520, partial [Planctomycetota bacterium]